MNPHPHPTLLDRLHTQTQVVHALQALLTRGRGQVETATVRRAIDGDTILLTNGERVRYIGMDTPELGDGVSSRSQPYARRAAEANAALVSGRRVHLLRDVSDRDRHGRLLRYVFVGGGLVNAHLLLMGLARLCLTPPDVRFADLLTRCEEAAQAQGAGMWARTTSNHKGSNRRER